MSKTLFATDSFAVCVGELADALAAMKPLGKSFTTVEFNAHGVRGCAVANSVAVKLHWVDGEAPREPARVARLFLLDFLKGAPDGALIHFEKEGESAGLEATVVKHGVSLTTRLPAGSELIEEGLPKWQAAQSLELDPVGAAAFFRVARCVAEDHVRPALCCVRLVPGIELLEIVGTDGREIRAEQVRLLHAVAPGAGPVSVPPLVVEVLGKWGKWKESRVEFASGPAGQEGCQWVAVACGGLTVTTFVSEEALKFPAWRQVLDGYGEPWIWRVPQSERERLAALVPVMPPDSWGSDFRQLCLVCEPGVTKAVSRLTLTMAGNEVPVRAELVEEPAGAGDLEVCLDPARFLSALTGGVEDILLRPSEDNDGAIVIFRGPGVRHGVMPMRKVPCTGEGDGTPAAGDASAPKQTSGATVTISTPGMAPVTLTEDSFKKLSQARKRSKKQAPAAGEEGENHG